MLSYIEKFINSIKVIDTGLTKVRIGSRNDGGYILLQELCNKARTVYSFGIGNNVDFELDFCDKFPNIRQINLFDPVIDIKRNNPKFTFNKAELGDSYDLMYNDFLRLSSNERKEHPPILKMDIEWDEWKGISELIKHNLSYSFFGQMVIEFHIILVDPLPARTTYFFNLNKSIADKVNIELFRKYYEVLEKLNRLFFCFHIHSNNSLPISDIKKTEGYRIPQLLEMSFVRKELVTPIKQSVNILPEYGLDAPNKIDRPDIEHYYPFKKV